LVGALVLALAGNAYLLVRSSRLNDLLGSLRDDTQAQFARLDSSVAAQQSDYKERFQAVNTSVANTSDSAIAAIQKARLENQRKARELDKKLEERQQALTGEISSLKDDTTSKIAEVSTDVNSVKSDVTGVKGDVASAHSELEQHGNDLKRVRGDLGVMSGLIATNSKDLGVLRELGERNYIEFTLSKNQPQTRVGDMTLTLRKTDPKKNRYTVEVMADDKRLEKRDRTINEPVQIYLAGSRQPNEIVVNEVKKDQVVGYLATPKVVARR
jgi:chromosome segregation ATPase